MSANARLPGRRKRLLAGCFLGVRGRQLWKGRAAVARRREVNARHGHARCRGATDATSTSRCAFTVARSSAFEAPLIPKDLQRRTAGHHPNAPAVVQAR